MITDKTPLDVATAAQEILEIAGDRDAARKLIRDTDAALTAMGLMHIEMGRQLADVADFLGS